MGGMITGTDKFFLVYYEDGAMHFEGEAELSSIAALAMRTLTSSMTPENRRLHLDRLTRDLFETFVSWEDEEPK